MLATRLFNTAQCRLSKTTVRPFTMPRRRPLPPRSPHYTQQQITSNIKNLDVEDLGDYMDETLIERRKPLEARKLETEINSQILRREVINDAIGITLKYTSLRAATTG